MLHDFNVEFGDPSPGPDVLEPRVRTFIEHGPKVFLLAGEGPHGFAQADFHVSVWADGPIAFLDELYVVPERRGKGLGRALMEAFLALARSRSAAGAEVVTGEGDRAARRLYESVGFSNLIEGEGKERALFYELDLVAPRDAA
jgi:GNAT superfamily N-acetyltransferase